MAKSLSNLFEEQARKTPNHIAISFNGSELTYEELDSKANCLAHQLIQWGVTSETIVAVLLDRNINLIISILAILKAGGAYAPIEPNYPFERIAFILDDCEAKFVITESNLFSIIETRLPNLNRKNQLINIDEFEFFPQEKQVVPVSAHSLAYIIYTSGSTGKPKGVMVEHKQVMRLFTSAQELYDFTEYDRWPLFHSIAFDVSVWEIWGALLNGGCLIIVPYAIARDTEAFYSFVKKEQVTVLNQTPSAFENFMAIDQQFKRSDFNLRYIVFAGEALNIQKLKPWLKNMVIVSPN
ncbi:AMP-binding protein [Legionella tunisiensis]|uniref:AMP-binding protein n=1 Tax=Legionella tunisiensis TaxID=1034944 RepID=UPI0003196E17|nr:AMP-binding protein [Legionella tunisiensis]